MFLFIISKVGLYIKQNVFLKLL